MSKRNCRRTEAEKMIHDFAVKVRKMTDQQLYDFYHESQLLPPEPVKSEDTAAILLTELESGACKGIGPAIVKKFRTYWEGVSECTNECQ